MVFLSWIRPVKQILAVHQRRNFHGLSEKNIAACQRYLLFCCIITAILDWYNPYMAFFEHIVPLRIMLYVSVILLALLRKRERPGMLRDR